MDEQTTMPMRQVQRKPRAVCVCGCGETGPIVGRGLRGRCYERERAAQTLERWPKVKRFAERLPADPLPRAFTSPEPEAGADNRLPETLILTFDRADRVLFDRLAAQALRARRTPEAQTLHLLEAHLAEG